MRSPGPWGWVVLVVASVARAEPAPMRVMAYNVQFDSSANDRSVAVVRAAAPDVVCLTELTPRFSRAFEARLSSVYPNRAFAPRTGTWGVGIASKFPIRRFEVFPERPYRIPAMEAELMTPGGEIRVVCVHLMAPFAVHRKGDSLLTTVEKNSSLRAAQGQQLVAREANWDGPLIVMGDMNEGPNGSAVKALEGAGLHRACVVPASHCGATFPGSGTPFLPLVEIDHILGRAVVFQGSDVLHEGGSDHDPVRATFRTLE